MKKKGKGLPFKTGTRQFEPSARTLEDAIADAQRMPKAVQSAPYRRRKRTEADVAFECRKYPGVFNQ